jgi:hypothetical protein
MGCVLIVRGQRQDRHGLSSRERLQVTRGNGSAQKSLRKGYLWAVHRHGGRNLGHVPLSIGVGRQKASPVSNDFDSPTSIVTVAVPRAG